MRLSSIAARPRRRSCHHGYRFGSGPLPPIGRPDRASGPRELGAEQLLDGPHVRRAARLLHHLADQEIDRPVLPRPELLHGARVLGDRLHHPRLQGGRVGDLPKSAGCHDLLDGLARLERLLKHLLGRGDGDRPSLDQADQARDVLGGDLALGQLDPGLVQQTREVLGHPVGHGRGGSPDLDGLLQEIRGRLRRADQHGLLGSQPELAFEPGPAGGGQLGEVRLGEVAVVKRFLLGSQRVGRAFSLVEVTSLLNQRLARAERGGLPLLLVLQGSFERANGVQVLDLDLRAVLGGTGWADRDVRVASERALLHPDVRDVEGLERGPELVEVRAGLLGRADVRLRDDLDERHAGPVVVDQRVLGLRDAPGRSHVGGLAGVLLHVHPSDADPMGYPIDLHVEVSREADRKVVLGDLEVLRHVRVEVVLPVEERVPSDLAVQRKTDPHDVLDRSLVRYRQRARKPQADGADVGVRGGPELVPAAAEHLRARRQLDVALKADDGLEVLAHASGELSRSRPYPEAMTRTAGPPTARADPPLVWVALGAVYIVWGTTYFAIRIVNQTMPPLLSASIRFLVAGTVMFAWTIRRGDRVGDRPGPRQWRAAAIVGCALLLGGNGGVVWAERTVPSGIVALIIALVPLWMALVDRVLLKHRLRVPTVVGLTSGFAGAALLVGSSAGGGGVDLTGMLFALAASLSWASGSLYSRHAPLPKRPFVGVGMEMLCGGVALGIVAILAE